MVNNTEVRIENWSVVSSQDPYTAPELLKLSLRGRVYDHPKLSDGKEIVTSSITKKDGDAIITFSGTRYKLGEVDPEYEKLYPKAFERLLKSLNQK